jgi:hypothetical protein
MKRLLLLMSIVLFASACTSQFPSATQGSPSPSEGSTTTIPEPGMGAIVGKITNADDYWPGTKLNIYAAEFYGDSEEEGVFLLETTLFPKGTVNSDSHFQINNVPPKQYILLVGPNPEGSLFVKENGRHIVVTVMSDQVVDVGDVEVGE